MNRFLTFLFLLSGASFATDNIDFNHVIFDSFNPKTLKYALNSAFAEFNNSTSSSSSYQCRNGTGDCLKTEMTSYLEDVVEALKNFDLKNLIQFPKNNNSYSDFEKDEIENEKDFNETSSFRDFGKSPLESLGKRFSNFMFTHDIEINLPDTLFESNVLQISPRAAKGKEKGIVAQFKILSKKITKGKPRILIKKIGEKLKNGVLALVLVLGLAKILISFLLPLIAGAAAAKKFLVKFLLFLFPFLAFFFKLCPYTPYGAKLHHHHHHLSHAHHVPHTPSFVYHDFKHQQHGHHHDIISGPDYHSEGPAFTNELISHRKDPLLPSTFVGQDQAGNYNRIRSKAPYNRPLTPIEIEAMIKEAEKEALLKARLQQELLRIQSENKRLQEEIKLQLLRQNNLRIQVGSIANGGMIPPKLPPVYNTTTSNAIQGSSPLPSPPNTVSKIKEDPIQKAAAITFDPFYSPILEKMEKILADIGIVDDSCRERLVCNMYKNPARWSPYSNLISVELSRDAKELQKPKYTNAAFIKFHRFVQAARDGQDQRNCNKLYSSCTINVDR